MPAIIEFDPSDASAAVPWFGAMSAPSRAPAVGRLGADPGNTGGGPDAVDGGRGDGVVAGAGETVVMTRGVTGGGPLEAFVVGGGATAWDDRALPHALQCVAMPLASTPHAGHDTDIAIPPLLEDADFTQSNTFPTMIAPGCVVAPCIPTRLCNGNASARLTITTNQIAAIVSPISNSTAETTRSRCSRALIAHGLPGNAPATGIPDIRGAGGAASSSIPSRSRVFAVTTPPTLSDGAEIV